MLKLFIKEDRAREFKKIPYHSRRIVFYAFLRP